MQNPNYTHGVNTDDFSGHPMFYLYDHLDYH